MLQHCFFYRILLSFVTPLFSLFAGSYMICLDNTPALMAKKLVHVYIATFVEDDWKVYREEIETMHLAVSNFTVWTNFSNQVFISFYLFFCTSNLLLNIMKWSTHFDYNCLLCFLLIQMVSSPRIWLEASWHRVKLILQKIQFYLSIFINISLLYSSGLLTVSGKTCMCRKCIWHKRVYTWQKTGTR